MPNQHSWKEISTTLWMYDDVPGVSEILRNVLNFRYLLAPTFYSLYVTDYQRNGWPLLKVSSIFPSPLRLIRANHSSTASSLASFRRSWDTFARRGVRLRVARPRSFGHGEGSYFKSSLSPFSRERRRGKSAVVRTRYWGLASGQCGRGDLG